MRLIELIPAGYRALALVLALALLSGLSAGGAWQVQDWRYQARLSQLGEDAAQFGEAVAKDASARALAVVAVLQAEQDKRTALEDRLKADDEAGYKERTRVQKDTQKLRDDLATTALRLSVVLASGAGCCEQLPAAAGTCSVVHGATRAELDPAHAQRIIGITGDGDEGLTALAACQAYVRAVGADRQRLVPP